MRDIAIGFLWHMHQPYYKDPITLLAQIIDCTDAGCRDADLMYHFLRMNWKLRDIRVLVYYPSQCLIKTMKG